MLKRLMFALVPVLLVLPTVGVRAQGDKTAKPGMVYRLKSIDAALETIKQVSDAMGSKEDLSKQFGEMLKGKLGPGGLEGIDTKRPLGYYGKITENIEDSPIVGMVPISNEKGFLSILENLGAKAKKLEDGTYSVTQDSLPKDIVIRFANQYAYICMGDPKSIEPKALLKPEAVFPANQKALISSSMQFDQIPAELKKMMLSQLDDSLFKELEKNLGGVGGDAEKAFAAVLAKEMQKKIKSVIEDSTEMETIIDLDARSKELIAEVTLASKSGSELAKFIEQLGKAKSLFSGMLHKDAAINALVRFSLPDSIKKAYDDVIAESFKKMLAEAQDEKAKKQAELLIKAMTPTLKHGEVDSAFSLRGPSNAKLYTIVAGQRVKEGLKLDTAMREMIKELAEGDKNFIKLDVAKVGAVSIHAIELGKSLGDSTKGIFGEEVKVFVALRDDAMLITMGEKALDAIKKAIAAPEPTLPSPPLIVDISMARLGEMMGKTDAGKLLPPLKALPADEAGRVRIAIEGGTRLRARFTMQMSVLKMFGDLAGGGLGLAP